MEWLKKRLKSTTIWLTTIAPTVLAFMTMYSEPLHKVLSSNYEYVMLFFAAIAYNRREATRKPLDDK